MSLQAVVRRISDLDAGAIHVVTCAHLVAAFGSAIQLPRRETDGASSGKEGGEEGNLRRADMVSVWSALCFRVSRIIAVLVLVYAEDENASSGPAVELAAESIQSFDAALSQILMKMKIPGATGAGASRGGASCGQAAMDALQPMFAGCARLLLSSERVTSKHVLTRIVLNGCMLVASCNSEAQAQASAGLAAVFGLMCARSSAMWDAEQRSDVGAGIFDFARSHRQEFAFAIGGLSPEQRQSLQAMMKESQSQSHPQA